MAKHYISARKRPQAELRAAPSFYERTHPAGSAERFLDEAAKEALAAVAAGGVITPRQAAVGAVRAVAKEAGKYPDPLLAEAAALPREELMKRAARAAAYEQAMRAQNAAADVVSTSMTPVADIARSQASVALATRQAAKGGDSTGRVAFDPDKDRLKVPEGREKEYEEYMDALANLDTSTHRNHLVPKDWRTNTEYNKDYDYVAAFLADKAQPVKADDGYWHMNDIGKMPNHPTFSDESYYAKNPRWAPYAGRWEDGKYVPPNVRQAAKGGDSAGGDDLADPPPGVRLAVPEAGGPRIVINPTTFKNSKDALCVAFNEGFRLWMEAENFEPQSEPTDAQRKFFSDTAYADDEVQLRRTILARIATFDTSVKDPTDDQLSETGAFLDAILKSDWCKNDWERDAVSRLSQAVKASVGAEPVEPKAEPLEAREPEPLQAKAALGAGETDEEKDRDLVSGSGSVAHYNEDGAFAGEDNPDGSYTLVSGSGETVSYNADGTLQDKPEAGESGQQDAPAQQGAQEPEAPADAQGGDVEKPQDEVPGRAASEAPARRRGLNGPAIQSTREIGAPESSRGLNGPAIQPTREIGAPESSRGLNGPAIQPSRWIGSLESSRGLNGPAIQPSRWIGSPESSRGLNGPAIQPTREIGAPESSRGLNGPAIQPTREIGAFDAGLDKSSTNRRRRKKPFTT